MFRLLAVFALVALPVHATEPSLYSGVVGASVLDSGVMVVASGPNAREETFEYVKRPDGGYSILNTITAANGSYRVNGRFDYDAQWNATSVHGIGVYNGEPVVIALQREPRRVAVTVTGKGKPTRSISVCDPTCLIDMAPSANPMFVMTRHYDFAAAGEQEFLWAGQDLIRPQALTDDHVFIVLKDEPKAKRNDGSELKMRHFFFLENIPQPNGQMFRLEFDIWTDLEHRPIAFRVRPPGSAAVGTVGMRKGFEEVRAQILPD